MFAVGADETIALARARGLTVDHNRRMPSSQPENQAADVEWTRLGFRRNAGISTG